MTFADSRLFLFCNQSVQKPTTINDDIICWPGLCCPVFIAGGMISRPLNVHLLQRAHDVMGVVTNSGSSAAHSRGHCFLHYLVSHRLWLCRKEMIFVLLLNN